jgi:hypothetical protein
MDAVRITDFPAAWRVHKQVLAVRDARHPEPFSDPQLSGFPWVELEGELRERAILLGVDDGAPDLTCRGNSRRIGRRKRRPDPSGGREHLRVGAIPHAVHREDCHFDPHRLVRIGLG